METRMRKQIVMASIAFFYVIAAFAQHQSPWVVPESAKEKKNPFVADESSIARGMKSYKMECTRCHGKEGKGDGSSASKMDATVANLTSEEVQNQQDGVLYWKISEGRKPMPLNKNTLTDDQRWDVINYIRTFDKRSTAQKTIQQTVQ
jgi:mono/diheme cytochrome c family protein